MLYFYWKRGVLLGNYFAKNIKYLRTKKNIDQQIMAEDLGVPQSTLSCWENGLRTPNLDMIAKISKYLNIYEDFITKDLTNECINDNSSLELLDQYKILFDKDNKLTQNQKEFILNFIKEQHEKIDEAIENGDVN